MTNPDFTAIKVVVDRSGSMTYICDDAMGALSEFIKEQATVPGAATIALSQFDETYEDVYTSVDIKEAPQYVLRPRGATALNDAIGKSIYDFGIELESMPEHKRPGNVIVVIITDGQENASHEYSTAAVKALVETQKNKYNWNFLFLAANQDAVLTGATYGFGVNQSVTFNTNPDSLIGTSALINSYVTTTRSGLVYQISDEDRAGTAQK